MAFRKGGESAQQASKQTGSKFRRTPYLGASHFEEGGGQVILRYLTESPDWIWVDQHPSAPTKNKPRDFEGNWPESMPAVCRYDEAFTDEATGQRKYADCYICDAKLTNKWGRVSKPTIRVWALACLREEVVGTAEMVAAGEITEDKVGKRLGFKDSMREVEERDEKGEPTGKTHMERAIVIVNQASNNYFNGLQACFDAYGKTNCDRDYIVKKIGEGKDVDFPHIPLDATPNLKPGHENGKWQRYLDAITEQKIDIEAIINDRASDEYFARFFDPNKTEAPRASGGSGSDGAAGAGAPPEAPEKSNDVDADKLAAMRARLRGTTPAGAGVGSSTEID